MTLDASRAALACAIEANPRMLSRAEPQALVHARYCRRPTAETTGLQRDDSHPARHQALGPPNHRRHRPRRPWSHDDCQASRERDSLQRPPVGARQSLRLQTMDAPYDASRPTPQPWNILNFYAAPAKNDPWVFPRGVIQTDRPSPAHLAVPPAFHGFRSRTESSDCATMPGDSGYSGSRQAHSTASTSVHGGDDLVLDAHMGQAMSECHINPDPAPAEPTCPLPPAPRHRCDDCNAHFRRECELK